MSWLLYVIAVVRGVRPSFAVALMFAPYSSRMIACRAPLLRATWSKGVTPSTPVASTLARKSRRVLMASGSDAFRAAQFRGVPNFVPGGEQDLEEHPLQGEDVHRRCDPGSRRALGVCSASCP